MEFELRLREVLAVKKAGPGFADRVMALVGSAEVIDIRSRRRSRLIVLGTLAAVAVAAAMLAWQMSGSGSGPESQQVVMPQPVTVESLELEKDVAVIKSPPPTDQGTSSEPTAAPAAAPPVEAPRRFTILVMPPVDLSADPAARPATAAFHSALLLELRRMPDLILLDSSSASAADSARAEFRLTVSSLEVNRLPSGGIRIGSRSGGSITLISGSGTTGGSGTEAGKSTSPMPGLGNGYWPVEATIEEYHPAPGGSQRAGTDPAAGRSFSIMPNVDISGAPAERTGCSTGSSKARNTFGGGSLQRVGGGFASLMDVCRSTARIAAALADIIRQQALDPAAIRQQLVAQMLNLSLQDSQRSTAMGQLLSSVQRDGSALDAASIAAISDYVSGLAPEQRKSEWLKLRNLKNPELVQPLLVALRQDTDESVRLAALGTLAANYGGEQPVLNAIDTVSRDDPREIVRKAARRVLHGDEEWRGYVKSTLRNANLPYADRLRPLLVTVSTSSTPTQFSTLRETLKDEEVTGAVIQLVREHLSDASQQDTLRSALSLLGNLDQPEVLDLQLEIVQKQPTPSGSGFPGNQLASEALQGLMKHREDPRVRKFLDQVMAGEKSPELRSSVETQLMMMEGSRR